MATNRTARETPNHILLGFWRFEPATQIVHADETVCNAFRVRPAEGREGTALERFSDRIHPDDREPFRTSLSTSAKTGSTFTHSYRIIGFDGAGEQPVFALGRAFHDRKSQRPYYVGALFEEGDTAFGARTHVDMVNHLIAALDVAQDLDEDLLAKLIEAVLLEAGRRLASRMGRLPDGNA